MGARQCEFGVRFDFQDEQTCTLPTSSQIKSLNRYPEGPCTQAVYTLTPKYRCRDYLKAVHGPLYPINPIKPLKEPLKESLKESYLGTWTLRAQA